MCLHCSIAPGRMSAIDLAHSKLKLMIKTTIIINLKTCININYILCTFYYEILTSLQGKRDYPQSVDEETEM